MPLDARIPGQIEAVFERITKEWGKLDFVVHSIAFAPQQALQGRFVDVPLDGFLTTMHVSCWTFLRMAQLAEPLMKKGGTLFTMTYYGGRTVVKNYNIMGVAKAALESAVRYVPRSLGRRAFGCMPYLLGLSPPGPPPAFPSLTSCSKKQRRRLRRVVL